MIRASHIPPLLSRICDSGITSAYLLTSDGELLGSFSAPESPPDNESSIGALVAEVAEDYRRAGKDFLVSPNMKCLLLEMETGLIGVANAGPDCYAVAVASDPGVEYGLLKARLLALASYVRETFTQLASPQP